MGKALHYGVADKAWQVVVGCDPHMPCAKRCWARKTVARVVACQESEHPDRAAFFQIALTADRQRWSGEVVLDEAHLLDPLHWRKAAVIATGFHGDIGRLPATDQANAFAVASVAWQHDYLFLTKTPATLVLGVPDAEHLVKAHGRGISKHVRSWGFEWPLRNVSIGCSVMYQSESDKMRSAMAALAALGWRTHVWYEPALGPVDWAGWEFIERLIYGGESGSDPRENRLAWARNSLAWTRRHKIAFVMKQLGAMALDDEGFGVGRESRKGDDRASIPADLSVRELPGFLRTPQQGEAHSPAGGGASNS